MSSENNVILRTFLLTVMTLESLDELGLESSYKQALKMKGNQFLKQLEKFCNDVFDVEKDDEQATKNANEYIRIMTSKFDELIKNTTNEEIKQQMDI